MDLIFIYYFWVQIALKAEAEKSANQTDVQQEASNLRMSLAAAEAKLAAVRKQVPN